MNMDPTILEIDTDQFNLKIRKNSTGIRKFSPLNKYVIDIKSYKTLLKVQRLSTPNFWIEIHNDILYNENTKITSENEVIHPEILGMSIDKKPENIKVSDSLSIILDKHSELTLVCDGEYNYYEFVIKEPYLDSLESYTDNTVYDEVQFDFSKLHKVAERVQEKIPIYKHTSRGIKIVRCNKLFNDWKTYKVKVKDLEGMYLECRDTGKNRVFIHLYDLLAYTYNRYYHSKCSLGIANSNKYAIMFIQVDPEVRMITPDTEILIHEMENMKHAKLW